MLSLAAALFGILAKQWLREYMRWNSPVGVPRENVLVRQIRYEAWEAWHVSLTILFIPALLELAMIMFLVGLVILLWTLDDIVAIVISVITGLFILLVSAFTICPIIYRHCPYQSPTAWAFLVLYDVARYITRVLPVYGRMLYCRWAHVVDLEESLVMRLKRIFVRDWEMNKDPRCQRPETPWHTDAKTWREYDIEGCRVQQIGVSWWWQSTKQDALEAARSELAQERTEFGEDDQLAWAPMPTPPTGAEEALLTDIAETSLLLRALSWTHQVFQDVRVGAYINQCMETIHPDIPRDAGLSVPYVVEPQAIRLITDWAIISSLWKNHMKEPELALETGELGSDVTDLRRTLGCRVLSRRLGPKFQAVMFQYPDALARCEQWWDFVAGSSRKDKTVLLPDLLAVDLQSASAALVEATDRQDTSERRVFELLCMLQGMPTSWKSPNPYWPRGGWQLRALQTILSEVDHTITTSHGLRWRAFAVACDYGRLSVSSEPSGSAKTLSESPCGRFVPKLTHLAV